MIERDYLMRMINVLIVALARVLRLKHDKEYPQALLTIQTTGKTLLGIDGQLVAQFSVLQLMQLFGSDLSVAVPKSYVLGVLLKEEAEIRGLMSEDAVSHDLYVKSLSLLIESYLRFEEPVDPGHLALMDEILGKLRRQSLPVDLLERVFKYEEAMGRYARAEDALHSILESEPGYAVEGMRFYERLLRKSDDQLAAGDLPRDEVLEAMAELKRR
jgi:hypothetical protein